jgi:hypothetical protein
MTIRFDQPPLPAGDVLERGIAAIQRDPDGISLLRAQTLNWVQPHRVYHLGLDAIEAGRGVQAAEPVAWRYIGASPQSSIAAEVEVGKNVPAFAGINEGPFVHGFSEQLQLADADQSLRGDFEPRLLDVPAVYVVALWLHDRTSQDDLFVPLEPANRAVQPGRRYSRADFDAALVNAAGRVRRPPAGVDGEPGTEAP